MVTLEFRFKLKAIGAYSCEPEPVVTHERSLKIFMIVVWSVSRMSMVYLWPALGLLKSS
jgi:hypothetical protein